MSTLSFKPATFAAFAAPMPTWDECDAAARYLRSFAADVLARSVDLTVAVQGRYDPADTWDYDREEYKQFVVISLAAYEQYMAAVHKISQVLIAHAAWVIPVDEDDVNALALEGVRVSVTRRLVTDMLARYEALPRAVRDCPAFETCSASAKKRGPWLAIGVVLLVAGVVYAKS